MSVDYLILGLSSSIAGLILPTKDPKSEKIKIVEVGNIITTNLEALISACKATQPTSKQTNRLLVQLPMKNIDMSSKLANK